MRHLLPTAAAFVLALTAVAAAQERTTAAASFVDRSGEEIGTADLTDTPQGVLIRLEVRGLSADRWVAFHVHETGECEPETGFESAGGHFEPGDAGHGYLAEGGPHAGDMPNQRVGSDGTLRAEIFNGFVRLADGDADIRGKALVVHGGRDDYRSQPSGDAGDRLACAVIE